MRRACHESIRHPRECGIALNESKVDKKEKGQNVEKDAWDMPVQIRAAASGCDLQMPKKTSALAACLLI